jgi:hypothetical protein
VLLELGQVVGDLEPRGLRADEDVLRRPDARRVRERAQRDVHVGAVPHHREEEGSAPSAARVVQVVVADDEERIPAVRQLQLLPLDPGERLERRPGRGATARAVAVRRVQERVRDPVANAATPAPAGERQHLSSLLWLFP